MIDYRQFRIHVVEPVLAQIDPVIPYSEEAVDLLMMTCAHESRGGTYIRQLGCEGDIGAFGVYQMELDTHEDIYKNFLKYKPKLKGLTEYYMPDKYACGYAMMGNLYYATLMARLHYYRVSEALPNDNCKDYLLALGKYAKKYYNTHLGKATEMDYVNDFIRWRDN